MSPAELAEPVLRQVPPVPPMSQKTMALRPNEYDIQKEVQVLTLRHSTAGDHKITNRVRHLGYALNREKNRSIA